MADTSAYNLFHVLWQQLEALEDCVQCHHYVNTLEIEQLIYWS